MAFKLVVLAAFVAVARAGILSPAAHFGYAAPVVAKAAYSPATAVSYSSVSSPAAYGAAPALPAFAPAVAKVAYSAAPAVSYSSIAAPAAYAAAPVAHVAAPIPHVAAPVFRHAAPVFPRIAAPVAYAAPIAKTIIAEPEAPANYDFGYAVNDPHTGDSKSQQESRHGDVVQGSYSVVEADGSRRIVEYTADAHNGFNAVVHKEPTAVAVKAVAPVIAKVAAPVAYGARAW